MNIQNINFNWLYRLGKVAFIILTLISIPFSLGMGDETAWGKEYSIKLFYSAIFLLIFYIFLVLATKTILYIVRGDNFITSGLDKKHYLLLLIPIVVLLISSLIYGLILEPAQKNRELNKLKEAHDQALLKINDLRESYRSCLEPISEEKYQESLRTCNLLKNKIKHDYNFCVSLISINSPASCLYEHDYQKIDCSEETIRTKINIIESDLSPTCLGIYWSLQRANDAIDAYKNAAQ